VWEVTQDVKRIVRVFVLSLVVVGIVGGVVVHERLGGWEGAAYQARLLYLAHVPPLTWPRDTFTPEAWARTPVEERYRFAKSLLKDRRLEGRTLSEVGTLLGGKVEPDVTQRLYPLRRAGFQNLWWVIVIELEGGHVATVRRDIAWLDP
jgi:hypothetical protein